MDGTENNSSSTQVSRLLKQAARRLNLAEQQFEANKNKLSVDRRERAEAAIRALHDIVSDVTATDKSTLEARIDHLSRALNETMGLALPGTPRRSIKAALGIVLGLLTVRACFFETFLIPSSSMVPTLMVGDHMLINRLVYVAKDPKRGEPIVFKYPLDTSKFYVKRVIALPGDSIRVSNRSVYVNGVKLVRGPGVQFTHWEDVQDDLPRIPVLEYAHVETSSTGGNKRSYTISFARTHPPRKPFPNELTEPLQGLACDSVRHYENISVEPSTCKVLPGYYFVMGDNRDNSSDSRVWGAVSRANIRGRAFLIWFSLIGHEGLRWDRVGLPVD